MCVCVCVCVCACVCVCMCVHVGGEERKGRHNEWVARTHLVYTLLH